MRALHFDIISGIAGDMTVAALTQLGASLEPLQDALAAMGLVGAMVSTSAVRIHGIGALRFAVTGRSDEHHHRNFSEIRRLLSQAGLPAGARERAEAMFSKLAEAEAAVHGTTPEQVTFHEVGALDSIADLVGCALALDHLGPDRISSSYPVTGTGLTQSQHGTLPVPAPATQEILKGIRLRYLDLEAELTTPTGAAILATQVQQFTATPELVVRAVGYGAGTRELPGRPNVLRLLWGETAAPGGEELLIEANLDDFSPALFEHLIDRLFEGGALDVWLQPVIMKKSRPAVVLALLCAAERAEALQAILFSESTTIGLRWQPIQRRKLERRSETVSTPYGTVRLKISGEGERIFTVAPEYEDCRARAREQQVPLKDVYQAARAAWEKDPHGSKS